MAELSFINETSHLHINQGLKTSCRADLEAMRQMGFLPDFKLFGKQERRDWVQKRIAAIRPAREAITVI